MTPYETQLSFEVARLRSALKVQTLLVALLLLIGAAKVAFLAGFQGGDFVLDAERGTLRISVSGASR